MRFLWILITFIYFGCSHSNLERRSLELSIDKVEGLSSGDQDLNKLAQMASTRKIQEVFQPNVSQIQKCYQGKAQSSEKEVFWVRYLHRFPNQISFSKGSEPQFRVAKCLQETIFPMRFPSVFGKISFRVTIKMAPNKMKKKTPNSRLEHRDQ